MNMLTSLDWLVIVFMGLAALTLLSLSLMFLIRNNKVKNVFFYIVAALGIYISSIGIRIGLFGMFDVQLIVGILTALVSIGAIVMGAISKGDGKQFLIARIAASAALIVGFFNAIL